MKRLGEEIDRLAATIRERRNAAPDASYTASLLAKGVEACAKKFGEEAVETILAAAGRDKHALAHEAGDALYHLLVLLESAGVSTGDVAESLAKRAGVSGHAEKAARAQSIESKKD
ncbi:MAG: phosphoribosyl-ATP diphosphatase [Parvularculaceae bacterium]|nr:phosphoribosyl-ATP diphosphatase [Parvularculaceae bacterium]